MRSCLLAGGLRVTRNLGNESYIGELAVADSASAAIGQSLGRAPASLP
jgi:hypothetical protein